MSVVYQAPAFDEDNFGISVQSCNGSEYLIWWSGTDIDERAAGIYHILDNTYKNIWNVTAVGFEYADAHDIFLTPECTAVFTVNEPREYDLRDFGIDNGWIQESYIQEVDLASNALSFQWRASDFVEPHDSFWTPDIRGPTEPLQGMMRTDSWDFFHINSVHKDPRGNYLISSRHYPSLYYIDGSTGSIHWTLGGKQNNFTDLSDGWATNFAWQHHARWIDPELTSISLFDDRNCRSVRNAPKDSCTTN
ncbi:hypothetical protein AAFC00_007339 [Neodothiora populina]|uniref:ASST-domain-containing protein n=1 Tax=Neodothiora populina TaxID=2781224 RepID=A0ABR3PI03_9PEZI